MKVYSLEIFRGREQDYGFLNEWSCTGISTTPERAFQTIKDEVDQMRESEWEQLEYSNPCVQCYRTTIKPLASTYTLIVRIVEWEVQS